MHTSSLGIVGAAAAVPLGQRLGVVDRAQHDGANQARQAAAERSAESAAGIGETDSDHPTSDRDADGRRIWEVAEQDERGAEDPDATSPSAGKDPTGQSGSQLDLSG